MADQDFEAHLRDYAALQEARALSERRETHAEATGHTIPASRIIAYARRADAVADFAVERALREQPSLRRIHDKALVAHAVAHSPRAIAAAGATQVSRMVGAHRVELIEEAGGAYLVIHLGSGTASVDTIEVRTPDGSGGRVKLGSPMRGIIQHRLDPDKSEQAAILTALVRPDAAIYFM
ncbi:MAG: hypothetical protein KDK53_24275 [Maritimibacter sp.]|nr:hypothetical protein [Maritimibacter sp.]